MPLIDLESTVSIRELLNDSKSGEVDLDPRAYWQRYALNTSLTLTYGYRIDGNKDAPLLKEIVDTERAIGNFRSTSNNWQDYIPLLRLWSTQNDEALKWKDRRDLYMDQLLKTLKDKIEKGTDKPCITGNIIKDPEAKLNEGKNLYTLPTSPNKTNSPQLKSNPSASPWSPQASTPSPPTSSWASPTSPHPPAKRSNNAHTLKS